MWPTGNIKPHGSSIKTHKRKSHGSSIKTHKRKSHGSSIKTHKRTQIEHVLLPQEATMWNFSVRLPFTRGWENGYFTLLFHTKPTKRRRKETFHLEKKKFQSEQIYYDSVYFMRIIVHLGTMNYIKRRVSMNITTELTRPIHWTQ